MAYDMARLKSVAKQYGIKLSGAKSPEAVADLLIEHFESMGDDNTASCHVCGKPSPDEVTHCPFCGVQLGAPTMKPGETDTDDSSDDDEDEDDDTDDEEDEDEDNMKNEKTTDETETTTTPTVETTEPATPATRVVKKVKQVKTTKVPAETTPATKPAKKNVKGKGKKNAKKPGRKPAEKKTEEIVPASQEQKDQLAVHTRKIGEFKADIARNGWKIGQELIAISAQGLWKGLGHKSFNEFLKKDLEFSSSLARKYIVIASQTTLELYEQIGVKKGELIAAAPDKHRPKMLEMATKEGASFSTLRTYLNKKLGKPTTGGHVAASERTITLLGRIREGEIILPWMNEDGTPIVDRSAKSKMTRLQLTDSVFVTVRETDNGLGLTFKFEQPGVKVEAAPPADDKQGTLPATK